MRCSKSLHAKTAKKLYANISVDKSNADLLLFQGDTPVPGCSSKLDFFKHTGRLTINDLHAVSALKHLLSLDAKGFENVQYLTISSAAFEVPLLSAQELEDLCHIVRSFAPAHLCLQEDDQKARLSMFIRSLAHDYEGMFESVTVHGGYDRHLVCLPTRKLILILHPHLS